MIGSNETYGASTAAASSLHFQEQDKEREIEMKIERLRKLSLESEHPEDQHQAIAILNFQLKRFTEALFHIAEAESKASSPRRIYLALLLRAKYFAREHLYSKAMQDLNQLKEMTDLPDSKAMEVQMLIKSVERSLGGGESKQTQVLPLFSFQQGCGESLSVYRARERAYHAMESSLRDLEEDREGTALRLQERYRGDKEALIDDLGRGTTDSRDGSSLYYQGQALARQGSRLIQEGSLSAGEAVLIKALDCFDRVLRMNEHRINEKNPDLWYFRSLVRAQLGHYQEALQDVERAIALAPREEKYYVFRSTLHEELGDVKGSSADRNALADISSSSNISEEGFRRLDQINKEIFLRGKDPELLLKKAEYLHMLGRGGEGVETAKELLALIDDKHRLYEKALALASHF